IIPFGIGVLSPLIVNGRKAILFHDFCKISFVLFSSLLIFFYNYVKFLSGKYCSKVCIMNALAFLSIKVILTVTQR
ncbi:hypothetical protein, partial [Peribacillus butanolivorans]